MPWWAPSAPSNQVDQGGGWLYHLLTKVGVSPDTASTVTDLVIRPLGIIFVVVVALIAARYGAKVIRRILERVANQAATRSGSQRAGARVATMSGVVANVWRFFVFVVAGAIVLGMLGINLTPLLASATIIGATLGFGAQQIVRDYFSGILMTVEDQYNVGDSVTVGGVTGVVEDVTMRLTRFRGVDGTIYVIPNGDIRLVGNLSRGWARAVVDLTLPGVVRRRPRDRAARRSRRRRTGSPSIPRVRRALHRAAAPRRPPRRGLDDHHDAGDAPHRPVPTRRADPGPARAARSSRWRRPTCGRPRSRRRPRRRASSRGSVAPGTGRLGRAPHGLDRRLHAGPQHELRRRLVHEHAEAVERPWRPRPPPRRARRGHAGA